MKQLERLEFQTYQKVPAIDEPPSASAGLLDIGLHDERCPYERGQGTLFVVRVFPQTRKDQ